MRLRVADAAAVQRGVAPEHPPGPARVEGRSGWRRQDRRDGARPGGAGRRTGDGGRPPGHEAVRRPGAAVGLRAHVREGARAAGLRRRFERAGRRDGAAAVGARIRVGGCDEPGGVASPRGLPAGRTTSSCWRMGAWPRRADSTTCCAPRRRCAASGRERWKRPIRAIGRFPRSGASVSRRSLPPA